jgi:Protein of unknown function (DUF3102)
VKTVKIVPLTVVKDSVVEINELHQENCKAAEATIERAIRIGELLSAQRALCKHGDWLPWLKANVNFDQKTAHNYQRIYKNRVKLGNVPNLAEAYRITLPKEKRKHSKVKPLTVRMFLGTCSIEEPLLSWRIVQDQNQENHQTIVCTKCWTHSTGGTPLAKQKERIWIFACRCPQSERSATIHPYTEDK